MRVLATAGHVDHGKSTLVRALTGMEPDRWAEERRRGMTIDLGYAWMPLGDDLLAFVDVPGHQRFIGNMLAGLGPAPAVLFVVAADEGWRRQSAEHLAAIDALGLRHGLLAVTRSDLADPAPSIEQARAELGASSLGDVEAVPVSARTGEGLDALRAALTRLVASLPEPDTTGRVRLWIDRSFTIRGTGTVVTGTLGAGRLTVGDELQLDARRVRVRSLQSAGVDHQHVDAAARVAVNLRGVPRESVTRGAALLTPDAWRATSTADVRLGAATVPREVILHVGSAAVPVHVRPLAGSVARLTLRTPLPLELGDRAILRDPGAQSVVSSVLVLDVDPPPLRRRGSAAARGRDLAGARGAHGAPRGRAEVRRRGAVHRRDLAALGMTGGELRAVDDWFVTPEQWTAWAGELVRAVDQHASDHPLTPGLPTDAARQQLGLPSLAFVAPLAADAALHARHGRVQRPDAAPALGAAEKSLRLLEDRLHADPFAAPERPDLADQGLGRREVAVAVATGRLIRLRDDVLLLPDAPDLAVRALHVLPQPFTTSQARQVLGTTRRVAIPLLEHLDAIGATERVDGTLRRVIDAANGPN